MTLDMNKLCIISIMSSQMLKNDINQYKNYICHYFTYVKLCYYMLLVDVKIICKIHLIKYML